MGAETIAYRPNTAVGLVFSGAFFVTSAILIWLGAILGPNNVAAMDGFNRILFTAIPIWLFSWATAVVFAFLGFLIARRTLRTEPTLAASGDGLRLPTGKMTEWSNIQSIDALENELVLIVEKQEIDDARTPRSWVLNRLRQAGTNDRKLHISSFALGACPEKVREELEAVRQAARSS